MKNNKPLNENFTSLLGDFGKNKTPDIDDIISSGKSAKSRRKKSVLDDLLVDELEQTQPQQAQPLQTIEAQKIIIPKSIAEQYQESVVDQIKRQQSIDDLRKEQKVRSKKKNKIADIINSDTNSDIITIGETSVPEKIQEINADIKQQLEVIKNEELPDDVNYVELEEEVEEALSEIPDGKDHDIIDVEIVRIESKKDKTGYFKTKVNIKKDNIPDQINKISSYIKSKTKGLISPRVVDLRVIGNTNKTQLKGSALKLSTATIVFKPDHTKLKVNKGTRFMISIPENYSSTGNILVYLQESRAKNIIEITSKDFPSEAAFNEFVGDRIAEFYFSGYDVTLKKIQFRKVDNPLMSLVDKILLTSEYKAKPYTDSDGHIYAVDFVSKSEKNQWLIVQVIEEDIKGTYKILALNSVDRTWEMQVSSGPVTLGQLMKNFYDVLGTCYDKDWTNDLDLESEDDFLYYMYDKLKHQRLKKALIFLNDYKKEHPEITLEIKETMSKLDTKKRIDGAYDAEAIIGLTNKIDWFILTYLAFPIVGGDKRKGRDYITTQEYYEKYSVKDRRDYQQREKTILRKENQQRNYNSRIYMFQLEYLSGGKKHIYRNTNWDELINATGLLTNNVKFPDTKF